MENAIILASGSDIRATLLRNAAVSFDIEVPQIDESTIRESLLAEGATPRDVADALAEGKALKVSAKRPEKLVIGCDQVLGFEGRILTKPETSEDALSELRRLRGRRHELLSAAVICRNGHPLWRHVGRVRLTMREASDGFLESYVARNWDSIRGSVGGYKLEEEGVRLFSRIEGDYFHVLGLPLIEILSYLTDVGVLET